MTITETSHGSVVVLSLEGKLMGEPDSTALRETIYRLADRPVKQVVLDCGGLKMMNSTGLGTVIAALSSMRKRGGDLRLAHLSEKVYALMTLTHLYKVFKIYETVERAAASFHR